MVYKIILLQIMPALSNFVIKHSLTNEKCEIAWL